MSVSDTLANDNHVVLDCCGGLSNVDYSKVDMSLLGEVVRHVDVSDPRFCVAVLAVLFNPFFWNVVARWEHRTRGLSRLFRSPSLACYCLGVLIILLNVYRSHSMAVVMKAQPRWELLDRVEVFYAGVALMAAGGLLVLTSFLSLGFTGTFLGDYFGILMDEPVTGFPFSLTENPMYWGSSVTYLGLALIGASPVGLVLTAVVFLSYAVAIAFEGPFTQQIYRERSQRCKHK